VTTGHGPKLWTAVCPVQQPLNQGKWCHLRYLDSQLGSLADQRLPHLPQVHWHPIAHSPRCLEPCQLQTASRIQGASWPPALHSTAACTRAHAQTTTTCKGTAGWLMGLKVPSILLSTLQAIGYQLATNDAGICVSVWLPVGSCRQHSLHTAASESLLLKSAHILNALCCASCMQQNT